MPLGKKMRVSPGDSDEKLATTAEKSSIRPPDVPSQGRRRSVDGPTSSGSLYSRRAIRPTLFSISTKARSKSPSSPRMERRRLSRFGPGYSFGEGCLVGQRHRMAAAAAMTECTPAQSSTDAPALVPQETAKLETVPLPTRKPKKAIVSSHERAYVAPKRLSQAQRRKNGQPKPMRFGTIGFNADPM